MKTLEWYLKNDKDKLIGATVRVKANSREATVVEISKTPIYSSMGWAVIDVITMAKLKFNDGCTTNYKPSSLELISLNFDNLNEEIYKTMEVNVINQDVIKANTAIKIMWQGDNFAYNCIVQYSTGKYIHCYGLGKTNKIERYAISADDLGSGKIQVLEIMEE